MNKIGFIILRHVNNEITNKYWIKSYKSIRKYYPDNYIIIIDDNSNYLYITDEYLYNTTIINSEYNRRGELLPYYYYLNNKLFDIAVIIHDSVFINKYIDFSVDKYKMLWNFEHKWDQEDDETLMIDVFNDTELKEFYENKDLWSGCFGAMTVIKHDYLKFINKKYELSKLLNLIQTKYNRQSFERVIACLLQKHYPAEIIFGDIHKYCRWGIAFDEIDNFRELPIIKVWSGR